MLTEELGAICPTSHSWTATLVEDMLHKARTGFTKAVVIGPGRAVLFYGRHSMGEGLRVPFMSAGIAQLVEQWTFMRQVPGSIPTPDSSWLGVDSALHPSLGRLN